MGEIIIRKVKGMNWKAKIALVLMFTLVFSTFLHQGLWKPKGAQAAAVTYYITDNSGTTVATGVTTNTTCGTNPTSAAPTPDINLLGTTSSACANNRTTGTYTAGATMLESIYNTPYSSSMTVTGTSYFGRLRDGSGGYTVGFQLFHVAANGTKTNFTGAVATQAIASGTSADYTVSLAAQSATVPSGSKLGIRIIYVSGSSTDARVYFGSTASAAGTNGGVIIVDEVTAGNTVSVSTGTNPTPSPATVYANDTNKAINGFTMTPSAGSPVVTQVSATVTNPSNLSSIRLYKDSGTVGAYDAGVDTLLATVATPGATANFAVSETVSGATNYLIVGDIAGTATFGQNITAVVSSLTVTAPDSQGTITDTSSTLTIGDNTPPVEGTLSVAVDTGTHVPATFTITEGFTDAQSTITGCQYSIVTPGPSWVAAAWNGGLGTCTATPPAQTDGTVVTIKMRATSSAGYNTPVNSLTRTVDAVAPSVGTLTGTPGNLKVTLDWSGMTDAGSGLAPTGTYTIRWAQSATAPATCAAGTLLGTYDDGTLTANHLGLTNGIPYSYRICTTDAAGNQNTGAIAQNVIPVAGPREVLTSSNLAVATTPQNDTSPAVVMQRITVNSTAALGGGDGKLEMTSLNLNYSGTVTNVTDAKVYIDTASTFNAGTATLLGNTGSWNGTATSVVFGGAVADREVTTGTPKYLYIVYSMTTGQATRTVTSNVTGILVSAPDDGQPTVAYSSNAITLQPGPVTSITSCAGCHQYSPTFADGTARNTPTGQFPGSHSKHVQTYGKACSVCHIAPATETSADFSHRNGTIQMASPINGDTGAAYTKGGSWAQTNSPSAFTGCTSTYCHSNGTSVATGTIPANTSTTWGGSTACNSCHGVGDANGRPNYANNSPKKNSHQATTHASKTCDVCHNATTTTGNTITTVSNHVNAAYNVTQGTGATFTYTYAADGGQCSANACHGDIKWGAELGCVDCHTSTQGTRDAVVGEFGLNWGHKKAGRAAVTDGDCIVCHLEGYWEGGVVGSAVLKSATYHLAAAGGNIDLRDPDGAGETPITNNSGGAFTFTKYAVSYAAGARTSTLGNTVAEVVTVKFCMKCHDSNGANNPTARSNASGTAFMPFGGVNLGANYTPTNGQANGTGAPVSGGLIDVATQFASTNSSRHPVGAPNSRMFPYTTRLIDPYKPGATRDSNTQVIAGTGTRVAVNSVIMVCDDCHTTGTGITTRTITAHGNAASLRGTYFVSGPTLCLTCHIAGTNGAYNNTATALPGGTHGTGSGYSGGTGATTRPAAAMNYCNFCHFSTNKAYAATDRPRVAQDVHGFNELYGTTAGWVNGNAAGMRPISFMRSWATSGGSWPTTHSPRPYAATGITTGAANCGSGTAFTFSVGSTGFTCDSRSHTAYGPGGSF